MWVIDAEGLQCSRNLSTMLQSKLNVLRFSGIMSAAARNLL
jgi:hypothetical protein